MTERALATIRRISALQPIEGADKIELAVVDGWKVIVKKGDYQVGQLAVYLEIDSWVPHTLAPFLTKNSTPKIYNGVEGNRLRTIKLRGQISQGLLLPVSVLCINLNQIFIRENEDVTAELGIQKWEKEIPASLAGVMKGNFPAGVPKTDQERIQNIKPKTLEDYAENHLWEVTEKLDGSSATFYLDTEGEFHVCSRNVNLKYDPENSFWKIAERYNIAEKMKDNELFGVAIQGELVGPGIQGNQYELQDIEFFVFDIYSVTQGRYATSNERLYLSEILRLNHTPVLSEGTRITADKDRLLKIAECYSLINASVAEGLVFKSIHDPGISFKAINNNWLLDNE